MKKNIYIGLRTIVILGMLLPLFLTLQGCKKGGRAEKAKAVRITSRSQLIGGPGAMGEVGDYLLENSRIRAIIQGPDPQGRFLQDRGFSSYGGNLIDADLVRPEMKGDSSGGKGFDHLGEIFTSFFLSAIKPEKIEIIEDYTPQGAVAIRVAGWLNYFLAITDTACHASFNSDYIIFNGIEDAVKWHYRDGKTLWGENLYILHPNQNYLEIVSTLYNKKGFKIDFSNLKPIHLAFKDVAGFRMPIIDIVLFGSGNQMFVPGGGYELRHTLENVQKLASQRAKEGKFGMPAWPGLAAEFIATSGFDGKVSYGIVNEPSDANFIFQSNQKKKGVKYYQVEDEDKGRSLVPFSASSFTGVMHAFLPSSLEARGEEGSSFSHKRYFVIGSGDVASIRETYNQLRGRETVTLAGQLLEDKYRTPVKGGSILIYRTNQQTQQEELINQVYTRANGFFRAQVTPGEFRLVARKESGNYLSSTELEEFRQGLSVKVEKGKPNFVTMLLPRRSFINVRVTDEQGRLIPAKVTVIGTYNCPAAGCIVQDMPRSFLYNLKEGEKYKTTDFIPDKPDDLTTRQYVEAVFTTANGRGVFPVKYSGHLLPGHDKGKGYTLNDTYTVVFSRGPEYNLDKQKVKIKPGETVKVRGMLKRVVDSSGFISADMHIHSAKSLDSNFSLAKRITAHAAEGVEYLVMTDHNYFTELKPLIQQLRLEDWMNSMVGVELTTLETGHFNAFPLLVDPASSTRGSFPWFQKPVKEIIATLKAKGSMSPFDTLVMVNHPRDNNMGYLYQFRVDPDTMTVPERQNITLEYILKELDITAPPPEDKGLSTDSFTWDFDLLEVFNGKRQDLIWTQVADDSLTKPLPANIDPKQQPGQIVRDEKGKVAFPGAVDDWYKMLAKKMEGSYFKEHYKKTDFPRYTAVANSDSHYLVHEPGAPRNYLYVEKDLPLQVSMGDFVDAVKYNRSVASYGPFINFEIAGKKVGAKVEVNQDSNVEVWIKVQGPDWMKMGVVRLIKNGDRLNPILEEDISTSTDVIRFEKKMDLEVKGDCFYTVEILSPGKIDRQASLKPEDIYPYSLWPVVLPRELPPLLLSEALQVVFQNLMPQKDFGNFKPPIPRIVTAMAVTNPIWVDANSDGFNLSK